MELKIPERSLVVLVGVTGSGKSSFATKHFEASEILNIDTFLYLINDRTNQRVSPEDAFENLLNITMIKLQIGKTAVIDATNIQEKNRKELIKMAKRERFKPVAIVLNLSKKTLIERNEKRIDKNIADNEIQEEMAELKMSLNSLKKEGFLLVYILNGEADINSIQKITKVPSIKNLKDWESPSDINGNARLKKNLTDNA